MANSSFKDRQPQMCDICGRQFTFLPVVEQVGDRYIQYCQQCFERRHNCITCEHLNPNCRFQTDPSDLPKVVQKTIQMGPVTQVAHIMNPERMAITCPGCICYENGECIQQKVANCEGYCNKHQIVSSPRNFIYR